MTVKDPFVLIGLEDVAENLRGAARMLRYLGRGNRKLTERLNRIRNITPGRRRIYELGDIAANLEIAADIEEETHGDPEYVANLRKWSLALERLEWDLGELRDASRNGHRRISTELSRLDPNHWKGPRP